MSSTMIVRCPHCSERMSVPADYDGLESKCPKCRKGFVFSAEQASPEPAPRARVTQPPTMPQPVDAPYPASNTQIMRMAGWICFGVGMVLLILCPIIPFYGPFFAVSFVLSIVLLAQREGRGGLALLLTTLLVPATVGALLFACGVGMAVSAFSEALKRIEEVHPLPVSQQTAPFQSLGQRAPIFQAPAHQAAPSRPMFFQPPSTPVQQLPPAQKQLPARAVNYDGLLQILNRYGKAYKAADTTVQKQDIRSRAQQEASKFVEKAQMTLVGTVRDVRYSANGKAALLFEGFSAPGSTTQADPSLSVSSFGELPVSMSRDEALTIRPGQRVTITGVPFLTARDNFVVTMLDEGANPSLITFRFLLDIETLLTLRMREYTVRIEK